ncbi:MAG: hypothetical protein IPL74_11920, partial [Bacteroidetes bacterium]|nr:hypothetical protein [Bacteroidota bacterium]
PNACKSVSNLAGTYEKATTAMNSLSTSSDDVKVYGDQGVFCCKNLAAHR